MTSQRINADDKYFDARKKLDLALRELVGTAQDAGRGQEDIENAIKHIMYDVFGREIEFTEV